MSRDSIVALATPFGRSGIGVIRLSGDSVLEITRKIIRLEDFSPVPRTSLLKKLFDETGELIDEALITYFESPHSFTGEDVVEIDCHGSPIVIRQIIDLCLKYGARLAEAGEFSLRALANGRMNLSQAEAIRDLIDAQTISSAKQSVRQLQGELSNFLQPLKDSLLNVIIVLESALEFVEDDLPDYQIENIQLRLAEISSELEKMAKTFRVGKLLREGLKVTLIGRPNVGKSSIFNALVGQDRAIVTEIAGTTRDTLNEVLTIRDIPIFLIDTAGLRETLDVVESIGVERTKRAIADADLVLAVLDGAQPITDEDWEIINSLEDHNALVIFNKKDLFSEIINPGFNRLPFIEVSAKTKEGIDELQNLIVSKFSPQLLYDSGFFISDARHFDLLSRAKTEIDETRNLLEKHLSEEILLIGLHNALKFLGEITGETTNEDILTRIFSTFCIGK